MTPQDVHRTGKSVSVIQNYNPGKYSPNLQKLRGVGRVGGGVLGHCVKQHMAYGRGWNSSPPEDTHSHTIDDSEALIDCNCMKTIRTVKIHADTC